MEEENGEKNNMKGQREKREYRKRRTRTRTRRESNSRLTVLASKVENFVLYKNCYV